MSFGDVDRPCDDDKQLPAAQRIIEMGAQTYRFAFGMAVLCILAGAAFTAGTAAAEPLWVQLLTFGLMGLLPAMLLYAGGLATFWVLKLVSHIYEPTVLVLSVTIRATIIAPGRIVWQYVSRFSVLLFRNVLSPAWRGLAYICKGIYSIGWMASKNIQFFVMLLSAPSKRFASRLARTGGYVSTFPVRIAARAMLKVSARRVAVQLPVSAAPPA